MNGTKENLLETDTMLFVNLLLYIPGGIVCHWGRRTYSISSVGSSCLFTLEKRKLDPIFLLHREINPRQIKIINTLKSKL